MIRRPIPRRFVWWIVETEELGRTATPGELFAHQAAEVVRGAPYRLKVIAIRKARPGDVGDLLAIKQSQQELREVQMDMLQKSGALNHRHRAVRDTGRIITLGSQHGTQA
ncbi:MAG TPA: hypothetical protein VFA39_19035 [Steroidobacteraceae bacterium]|nr:hypothetical protein [Steroidobacteraceae bacterium]